MSSIITVKVSKWDSMYFPVRLDWKVNSVDYSMVFENDDKAADYIFGRYGNRIVKIVDTRNEKPQRKQYFKRGVDIPKKVRQKTYYNMKKYNLCLYDAFDEAVRSTPASELPKELIEAWYFSNYRKYLANTYSE